MPLGPFDEFLAHQTSDTFDHVVTSDRNFYDRYYFNMHSSSDELFVITGLGQYPNLGVTDAFITVSIGTEQHTVRASRELGSDRLDTTVGPLVGRGRRRAEGAADPLRRQRVGHRRRPHLHRHRRRARGAAHVHPPVRPRDPGRHAATRRWATWKGTLTVAGRTFDVTPDRWKGARDRSWGVRPVGEPEAPGHPGARARRTATGSATTGCRCSSTTTCSRSRSTRTPTVTVIVEESMRVWNVEHDRATSKSSVGPRSTSTTSPARARCAARRSSCTDVDGTAIRGHEHAAAHAVPRRGLGLREPRRMGPRRVPGSAEGRGRRPRPVATPRTRRRYAILNETLCRFELATGEVGYGMHENLLVGIHRPSGFLTPDAVAP